MTGAAKKKMTFPGAWGFLRVLLLLVVALCLPETRVWGLGITAPPAPGVFESASPSSIGEFTTDNAYDAPDCTVAPRAGVGTATDQAVFWSGRNGANFSAATDFAESTGRLTLEMTPGGRALPAFSDSTRGLWESASRSFAQEASGTVNAFTVGARPGSVFNTIEKPALLLNPNVRKINVIDQLHPERTHIIYPNRP